MLKEIKFVCGKCSFVFPVDFISLDIFVHAEGEVDASVECPSCKLKFRAIRSGMGSVM